MKYRNIGKYIRQKRLLANISFNSFAFSNDIDPAILSRIETQQQNIKLNILEKIANGFEMTPAQFLTEFEATNGGA